MTAQSATDLSRAYPVTSRLVFSIAVPMTLAHLATPLLGLVDTAVVGRLGDAAALGGLAAGAVVFDLVFASFNFLRTGTTGLVAQALGRGDRDGERAVLYRASAVAIAFGLVLVALSVPIAAAGRAFMGGSESVGDALSAYLVIRMVSAPAALLNYALLGYLVGRGRAVAGLSVQILLAGINIPLSILLGLTWGYGLAGVAVATVFAEFLAAAAGMSIVLGEPRVHVSVREAVLARRSVWLGLFTLNRDIVLRTFLLLVAFALFTRQGAHQGEAVLAANAVLMNFFLVGAYFLDGLASAAEQLCGRAVGAGSREAFRRSLVLVTAWSALMAALATLFLWFAGHALITLISTAPEVRTLASNYLPWAALTAVSGVLAFVLDGAYLGATWSRDLRNMMILSFAAYGAALWAFPAMWGNHGLWAALHVFLVVRGVTLLARLPARVRANFGAPYVS